MTNNGTNDVLKQEAQLGLSWHTCACNLYTYKHVPVCNNV